LKIHPRIPNRAHAFEKPRASPPKDVPLEAVFLLYYKL
jgi:hypothetical protein